MSKENYNVPTGLKKGHAFQRAVNKLSSPGRSINNSPRNQPRMPEGNPEKTTHLLKTIKPSTSKDQNEDIGSKYPISNYKRPFYILSDASLKESRNKYSPKSKKYK